MIIKGEGYTFNTETRKIEFGKKVCWNCNGEGKVKRYPACNNYGQTVTQHKGRKCPLCGAKNKHSHGRKFVDGVQVVEVKECHTCKGTGLETVNHFSSLNFLPIADTFKLELFNGKQTFNDAYLGMGNFGGCTGYTEGKFITKEACMAHLKEYSFGYTQAGNLVTPDGSVPDTIYIKVSGGGRSFTGMLVGTRFGRR